MFAKYKYYWIAAAVVVFLIGLMIWLRRTSRANQKQGAQGLIVRTINPFLEVQSEDWEKGIVKVKLKFAGQEKVVDVSTAETPTTVLSPTLFSYIIERETGISGASASNKSRLSLMAGGVTVATLEVDWLARNFSIQ